MVCSLARKHFTQLSLSGSAADKNVTPHSLNNLVHFVGVRVYLSFQFHIFRVEAVRQDQRPGILIFGNFCIFCHSLTSPLSLGVCFANKGPDPLNSGVRSNFQEFPGAAISHVFSPLVLWTSLT
jgi:hypothetical protein